MFKGKASIMTMDQINKNKDYTTGTPKRLEKNQNVNEQLEGYKIGGKVVTNG